MTQPTGRPPGGLDVAARVGLVLVLLALAAHGLSGRRGLDWSEVDSSPSSAVGLLLAAVAGAVLVVAVRVVVRSLRKAASAIPYDEELPDIEGRPLPWWFWLGAGLLTVGVLYGVYELVRHVATDPEQLGDQGDIVNDPASRRDPAQPPSALSLVALVLGGVAAAIWFGARLVASRRAAAGAIAADEPDGEPADLSVALAGALDVAGDELGRHDDERTAIVAAYRAMERHLTAVGAVRRPADTPTEFLRRAVATARVSRGAATTLTELFREARFSSHPMPPGARDDAARALARVAADLTDVRA